MSCEICRICGELKVDWKEHKCPPIFYFKHEDWGDEFEEIRGYDFDDAAENFARKYNQDDYVLMNNSTEVIISDGKTEKKFRVSAEPDIYYSVNEID